MNRFPARLTDLQVLLHCDAFRCHVCADEPTLLYRVRIQEVSRHPYLLEEEERFVIRRRLLCDRCFRAFVYPGNMICAFATIASKTWCLRQRPSQRAPIYTRERWLRYVDQVRGRRQKTELKARLLLDHMG